MQSLFNKRIVESSRCPRCPDQEEDTLHALVSGRLIHQAWPISPQIVYLLNPMDFANWWALRSHSSSPEALMRTTLTCWEIWCARNTKVWNNFQQSLTQILRSAEMFINLWYQVNPLPLALPETSHNRGTMEWEPSGQGYWKCNVDGAVFNENKKLGFGFIIRDFKGRFIAAKNGMLEGPSEAGVAEVMSFREVLRRLKKKGYSNILVEGECLHLVLSVNHSSRDHSITGIIIGDCKTLMKEIPGCCVNFYNRSTNRAAQLLVRAVNSMSDQGLWVYDSPHFLSHVLSREKSQ